MPKRRGNIYIHIFVGCWMSVWLVGGHPLWTGCQCPLLSWLYFRFVDFWQRFPGHRTRDLVCTAGAIGDEMRKGKTARVATANVRVPDPRSCCDMAAAPAGNYFTFCKQTNKRTNARHIKLISTLKSRRRNCYFAWNFSTPSRGSFSIYEMRLYLMAYPAVPAQRLAMETTPHWTPYQIAFTCLPYTL